MAHLLVLAGGFGTRLREFVTDVPKPLAPVAGRPFLKYLNDHWVAQGISEITYLLHHQAGLIEAFLAEQQRSGNLSVAVNTVVEAVPMGTGGAIANAVREMRIRGDFLIANADTWLGGGIRQMIVAGSPAMATLQVMNVERYGSVEIADGRIVRFREKQDSHGQGWINAGLYHLHSDMFADWNGEPFSIEREIFPRLAVDGQLATVELDEEFIDIGVPEDYLRFCRWIESGKGGVL